MTINILGWKPSRWSQIAGNRRLKETLRSLISRLRVADERRATRLLIESPSRTGKTVAVELFAKAALCPNLNSETLDPCGKCEGCRRKPEDFGDVGLFSYLKDCDYHYLPIDCTKIESGSDLNKLLRELHEYEGTRIVFFDEIHRLQRGAMDEKLLKEIEQKGFVWIACAADVSKLEQMFINRFVKLKTELPGLEEMSQWLIDRCREFHIPYEEEAIMELAERSNRVPGIALQGLDYCSLYDDGLTMKRLREWHHSTE